MARRYHVPSGRYRGAFLADVPDDEIERLLARQDLKDEFRAACIVELHGRESYKKAQQEAADKKAREEEAKERERQRKERQQWRRGYDDDASDWTRYYWQWAGYSNEGSGQRQRAKATSNGVKWKPTASKIIEAGYKQLALKNHPDRGGSTKAMVAVNEAVEHLREFVK